MHRLAQPAVIRISLHIAAGFGVEKDLVNYLLHLSQTCLVRDKRRGATSDVTRTRVTGDEVMNQLRANVRAYVGVVKNVVDRSV